MASKTLSEVVGGGSGLPKLAPDLTYPSTLQSGTGYVRVTINAVGSLTTALSLSGKFVVERLEFDQLLSETVTIKLTIDGTVIWNDTYTSPAANTVYLLGLAGVAGITNPSSIRCDSSLLLELQTTTDTSVNLQYVARPIL